MTDKLKEIEDNYCACEHGRTCLVHDVISEVRNLISCPISDTRLGAEAEQTPTLWVIKRRGRIEPNHYLHAENAAGALGKWGGELIALYDAFAYKCPFCNTWASGSTALREHLLACEDFNVVHRQHLPEPSQEPVAWRDHLQQDAADDWIYHEGTPSDDYLDFARRSTRTVQLLYSSPVSPKGTPEWVPEGWKLSSAAPSLDATEAAEEIIHNYLFNAAPPENREMLKREIARIISRHTSPGIPDQKEEK